MGHALSRCGAIRDVGALGDLPQDVRDLPPFFTDIILELSSYKRELGGVRNFADHPQVNHKVKAEEFRHGYTDYEYIYMTVLGFARLHTHVEEIVRRNNGETFTQNPGVQMLERSCGMTMHGNREGANALLRSAPASMLEAFQVSKSVRGGSWDFFKEAFDRRADPCLEGRTGRIMEYLEKMHKSYDPATSSVAPWEDISLRPMPGFSRPRDMVGEHLRVFVNECTWRWARENEVDYEDAKAARFNEENASEFSRLYNATTFEAAMRSRGVVIDIGVGVVWETLADDRKWVAYDADVNSRIKQACLQGQSSVEVRLGPKGWKYELDTSNMVQRNTKSGRERPIRCVKAPSLASSSVSVSAGKLSQEELMEAIRFFVDLETLPIAPASSTSGTRSSSNSSSS